MNIADLDLIPRGMTIPLKLDVLCTYVNIRVTSR